MTAYRIRQQMLDPKTAAEGPLKLLGELNTDRADAQAALADALRNSPHSPQVPVLRVRVASLTRLIAEERSKITGDSGSVAAAQTGYERLDTDRKLADKQLASAYKSLEAGAARCAAAAALPRNDRAAQSARLPALPKADGVVFDGLWRPASWPTASPGC